MPGLIKPNRPVVDHRQSVAGFTIITPEPFFEAAFATRPELLLPQGKAQRTPTNFWSTRALGPLTTERGETVFILPPDVLRRFAGQERVYSAVATFDDRSRSAPKLRLLPPEVMPFITLSRSYTGRPLRSVVGAPARGSVGDLYGARGDSALEWAADTAQPGADRITGAAPQPPANGGRAPGGAPANGDGEASGTVGNGAMVAGGAPTAAASVESEYDDGYDARLWESHGPRAYDEGGVSSHPEYGSLEALLAEADYYGINGPIPDDDPPTAVESAHPRAFTVESPEYAGASRFVPAHSGNFTRLRVQRPIERVVIHITAGGSRIDGTIGWFQNPQARVSSHYIVGLSGEVVQMVKHNDVAWHANRANRHSIGIEHTANPKRNIWPTAEEYLASARLVRWLCRTYDLPLDREHILGHAEADPQTTHTSCPDSAWNWEHYMKLVLDDATDSATSPPPLPTAVAKSLSVRPKGNGGGAAMLRTSGALGTVQPYGPADTSAALALQKEWQDRFQQWQAGVDDTSLFPHSAICQFEIDMPSHGPGVMGLGTGFYIQPDLILTCAHNVVEPNPGGGLRSANSLTVIRGRNGLNNKPFGSFKVKPSDWEVYPLYKGEGDFGHDMAVIRVPESGRVGQYFYDLQDERVSHANTVIVCGYAAKNVDPYKQHLDGDTVREISDDADFDNIRYNLQTEPGASGSPVYYLWVHEDEERRQSVLEITCIGVHVSGFGSQLNQACRVTQAKIDWINAAHQRLQQAAVAQAAGLSVGRRSARPAASRQLSAPAVAGKIGEMVVGRLLEDEGGVEWELEQGKGLKHPWDDKTQAGPSVYKSKVIVEDEPAIDDSFIDTISASFQIRYDYNGRSLGNIEITNLETNDALGWGLKVKATLMDDANAYIMHPVSEDQPVPSGMPGAHAAVKLRFHFRFSHYFVSDQICIVDYKLFGNGLYERVARWTQATFILPVYTPSAAASNAGEATAEEPNARLSQLSPDILPAMQVVPPPVGVAASHLGRSDAPARQASGPGAAIITKIGEAVVTRLMGGRDQIKWALDKMEGLKHPWNDPAHAGPTIYQTQTLHEEGATIDDSYIDEIGAEFDIRFQYNGRSVGNIYITNVSTNDAIGWELDVTAELMDDANAYTHPTTTDAFAAVELVFNYRFSNWLIQDQIAEIRYVLYGNGIHRRTRRWTQYGMF